MGMTARDHALAVIKAGLSAVPTIGGPLASLIGDYIPASSHQRIEQAVEILSEQLRQLESRLDLSALNKEDFAELFKSSYLTIVRTHREEKIRAAVSVVSNICLRADDPEKLSFNELDLFSRAIDQLSAGALQILARIYSIAPKRRIVDSDTRSFSLQFEDICRSWPEQDPSFVMALVGELNAFNLLHIPGAPTVRTPHYGNYPVELTPLGVLFVERILPEPVAPGR